MAVTQCAYVCCRVRREARCRAKMMEQTWWTRPASIYLGPVIAGTALRAPKNTSRGAETRLSIQRTTRTLAHAEVFVLLVRVVPSTAARVVLGQNTRPAGPRSFAEAWLPSLCAATAEHATPTRRNISFVESLAQPSFGALAILCCNAACYSKSEEAALRLILTKPNQFTPTRKR